MIFPLSNGLRPMPPAPPFINVAGTTMARTLFRSVLNNDICRLVGRSVFWSGGLALGLSVCVSGGRSGGLPVTVSICQFACWSICLYVVLVLCRSVRLSVCRSVDLSVCRSVALSLRRFVCLVVGRGGR